LISTTIEIGRQKVKWVLPRRLRPNLKVEAPALAAKGKKYRWGTAFRTVRHKPVQMHEIQSRQTFLDMYS
jgi:hypothetical protein